MSSKYSYNDNEEITASFNTIKLQAAEILVLEAVKTYPFCQNLFAYINRIRVLSVNCLQKCDCSKSSCFIS